jgi:hypothetical protein
MLTGEVDYQTEPFEKELLERSLSVLAFLCEK